MSTQDQKAPVGLPIGRQDGSGGGDHDEPYRFGRRPTARAPFPFTEHQYARLLVLRSRVRERPDACWQDLGR